MICDFSENFATAGENLRFRRPKVTISEVAVSGDFGPENFALTASDRQKSEIPATKSVFWRGARARMPDNSVSGKR